MESIYRKLPWVGIVIGAVLAPLMRLSRGIVHAVGSWPELNPVTLLLILAGTSALMSTILRMLLVLRGVNIPRRQDVATIACWLLLLLIFFLSP